MGDAGAGFGEQVGAFVRRDVVADQVVAVLRREGQDFDELQRRFPRQLHQDEVRLHHLRRLFAALKLDLAVVVAYGLILPKPIN